MSYQERLSRNIVYSHHLFIIDHFLTTVHTMNRPFLPFLFILFLAFLLQSCGSDSNPTDINEDNQNQLGTAMTVDGSSYNKVAVVFDTSSAKISYRYGKTLTQFDIDGTITSAKPVTGGTVKNISLSLQFPDSTVAQYSWSDLARSYSTDIAVIEIDGDIYYPISGTTTVERYDSAIVSGSFAGTLFSTTSQEEIVITGGRFIGRRSVPATGGGTGGTGKKPQDHDLYFVLDGGEFSNDTIAILSSPSLAWVQNDGGTYLDILLTGGEVAIPGGGSLNAAGTIEFPGSTTGISVWGAKKHSKLILNINGEIYIGTSGVTEITQYGQAFFSVVAGRFNGTVTHSENGQKVAVKNGWFKCARGN